MKNIIFASAIMLGASYSSAVGDTVSMRLASAPSSVDLSNSSAFAFYGDSNNAVDTDTGNRAGFTAPAYVIQSDPTFGTPGSSGVTGSSYTAVSYDAGAPAGSVSGNTDFAASGFQDGSSLSVTTALISSSETLDFYLTNYNATSDLSLTLGGSTFTLEGAVLMSSVDGLGDGTGTGTNSGLLAVTVSGSVGDSLTFTDTTDETGVGNSLFGNVGLQAITVATTATPEPGTWALLLIGSFMLLPIHRRLHGMEKS